MSVRDRYRLLRGRGATGPWSPEEVTRLQMAVQEVRNRGGTSACWQLISERVGTRSIPQCVLKWTSLEGILRNGGVRPTWTQSLDYHLISRLYDLAVEDESEVQWKDLFDEGWPLQFTPRDLLLRFRALRKRIRGDRSLSFDDLLEGLLLNLRPLSADTISDEDDDRRGVAVHTGSR